jgi:hypothetical protein
MLDLGWKLNPVNQSSCIDKLGLLTPNAPCPLLPISSPTLCNTKLYHGRILATIPYTPLDIIFSCRLLWIPPFLSRQMASHYRRVAHSWAAHYHHPDEQDDL